MNSIEPTTHKTRIDMILSVLGFLCVLFLTHGTTPLVSHVDDIEEISSSWAEPELRAWTADSISPESSEEFESFAGGLAGVESAWEHHTAGLSADAQSTGVESDVGHSILLFAPKTSPPFV